jgi:hypothetical protein
MLLYERKAAEALAGATHFVCMIILYFIQGHVCASWLNKIFIFLT